MKRSKKAVMQCLLIAALALGVTWLLPPSSEAANPCQSSVPSDWERTPEADLRTEAGDCENDPNGAVCREEIVYNECTEQWEVTGNFQCYRV